MQTLESHPRPPAQETPRVGPRRQSVFNKHPGDSYALECAYDLAPLSAFQLLKPGQNFNFTFF